MAEEKTSHLFDHVLWYPNRC